jgi:5-oxoprolinase (ATP-hydrolysing)
MAAAGRLCLSPAGRGKTLRPVTSPDGEVSLAAMQSAFETAHRARFGFVDASKSLVVEAVSVEAIGASRKFAEPSLAIVENAKPEAAHHSRF